jgi:crossover junction endodeoxyribonuclease RuvC
MSNRNKSVILGLDVSSSSTGYAVLRCGRWNKSKASFGKIKIPVELSLPKRLVMFRDELLKVVKRIKPTHIIIEDVFSGRNVATMKLLARFNGVAIEVSSRCLNKDPVISFTAAVRGFLECGRSKEEAFDFICTKYKLDWSFNKMNDVTDALALVLYYYKLLLKEK